MNLRAQIEHEAFDQLICQDVDISRMMRWSGPNLEFGFMVDGKTACTVTQRFDGLEDGEFCCVFEPLARAV